MSNLDGSPITWTAEDEINREEFRKLRELNVVLIASLKLAERTLPKTYASTKKYILGIIAQAEGREE